MYKNILKMKHLKRFKNINDFQDFKNSSNFIVPNVSFINENKSMSFKPRPITPANSIGDVAYWDGSRVKTISYSKWDSSLGTPIGVVAVPKGFAPDGKTRIVSLKFVDSNGQPTLSQYAPMAFGGKDIDTPLTNYAYLPITTNIDNTANDFDSTGSLPSDRYSDVLSFVDNKAGYKATATTFIPSSFIGNKPNPEYYKIIEGGNALSDFNGLQNTQILVGLGSDYIAANNAYKYTDGVSNLQWYLPAIGELGYTWVRNKELNDIIKSLGGENVTSLYSIVSSTERSSGSIYYVALTGVIGASSKSNTFSVRPFAII